MSSTLVIGSVALDSVETPFGRMERGLGGAASYGSVAASYFAPTSLVGVVGKDFPRRYIRGFQKRGINLDGLRVEDGETFFWSGYYERNMGTARTNTTALNVFRTFRPELPETHRRIPFVFLANIDPELQYYVVQQLEDPQLVALDTMNFWIEGSKKQLTKVIRKCSFLLMNEEEARQYCETPNVVEAGRALLRLGPRTVAIKKGEHGALVFQKGGIFSAPAYPLDKLKDPTGAGDTFAGSLVGYLARLGSATDENVRRAILVGTVMASFVVEDFSLRRTLRIKPGEIAGRIQHLLEMTKIPKMNPKSFVQYRPDAAAGKPRA